MATTVESRFRLPTYEPREEGGQEQAAQDDGHGSQLEPHTVRQSQQFGRYDGRRFDDGLQRDQSRSGDHRIRADEAPVLVVVVDAVGAERHFGGGGHRHAAAQRQEDDDDEEGRLLLVAHVDAETRPVD